MPLAAGSAAASGGRLPIHGMNILRRLAGILVHAVFPGICCGCGALYRLPHRNDQVTADTLPPAAFAALTGKHLCGRCRNRFTAITSPMCEQCGQPFASPHGVDHLCSHCKDHPFIFSTARAAGVYAGGLRAAILHFKYKGGDHLARPLGELLWQTLLSHWQPACIDCVVPVPLHPRRLRWRGFNQAFMLMRQWPVLAQRQGLVVARGWIRPDLIQRRKYTQPQTGLKKAQRTANLRNAFAPAPDVDIGGLHILLVDDVFTTGATVDACARILMNAGAAQVHVLTLARAAN